MGMKKELVMAYYYYYKRLAVHSRDSDIPISPQTTAPQYQPIDRKKGWKIVEDYCRDREA